MDNIGWGTSHGPLGRLGGGGGLTGEYERRRWKERGERWEGRRDVGYGRGGDCR